VKACPSEHAAKTTSPVVRGDFKGSLHSVGEPCANDHHTPAVSVLVHPHISTIPMGPVDAGMAEGWRNLDQRQARLARLTTGTENDVEAARRRAKALAEFGEELWTHRCREVASGKPLVHP